MYLAVRAPALLDDSRTNFDSVGVLWRLEHPLGGRALGLLLSFSIVAMLYAGLRHVALFTTSNVDGATDIPWVVVPGSLAVLVLLTHRSSLGQILWFDVLMMLHVLVLAGMATLSRISDDRRMVAGWGLRLAAIITITTYVVSAVTKLRIGGLEWVGDEALQRHITYTAIRADALGGRSSPVAQPFVNLGLAGAPAAAAALALELFAPLALFNKRTAWIWAACTWLMHATVAATMFIVFHWPLLGLAFAPVILAAGGNEHGALRRSR